MPVEVSPEVITPEIEVLPIAPEAEAEICQTEEQAPEVIEIPEIEVIVPEAPEVKPQPIVPEVPEIEVIVPEEPAVESCVESETAGIVRPLPEAETPGLVRPLPVEENPAAITPEVEVLPSAVAPEINIALPNLIIRNV